MPHSPRLQLLARGHPALPVARDANPQGGGRMCFPMGKELTFGQNNLWPTISWSQQLPLPDGCSLGCFWTQLPVSCFYIVVYFLFPVPSSFPAQEWL